MTVSARVNLIYAFAELLAGTPIWMAEASREWPLFADASRLAVESPSSRRAILSLREIPPESLERRHERYDSLFNGKNGRPHLWLYESVTKIGHILSPETFAIARLYQAAGLETNMGAELPDHCSLELSFLAYLGRCAENDLPHMADWRVLEQQFLNEHGGWLIELGRSISASGDQVYAPIGEFLADWLNEAGQENRHSDELADRPSIQCLLPAIPNAEACSLCGFCVQVCPVHALAVRETESDTLLVFNVHRCIGCGKCVQVCDSKAISLTPDPFPYGGGVVGEGALRQSPRVLCPSCGKPTVSRAELDYVGTQLGSPAWLGYCLDCRPQLYMG